jgi:hypothetical protein
VDFVSNCFSWRTRASALFNDLGVRTLGRETERTDLGGESGGGTDFTTGRTEVDDLDLGGIELGSCRSLARLSQPIRRTILTHG